MCINRPLIQTAHQVLAEMNTHVRVLHGKFALSLYIYMWTFTSIIGCVED